MPRVKIEKPDPATFNQQKQALLSRFAQSDMTLGEATKALRLLLGMTQAEFGKQVVGLSRNVVSAIERDEHNPELETLNRIGKPFGLRVAFCRK